MFTSMMPNVITPGIDRAVTFYRDLVGLGQAYRFPREGQLRHVELDVGNGRLALSSCEPVREVSLSEPGPGHR
jgi:catechol 2,3-dioxygenase-like lactoylglutathione lyase family enzyme